MNDLKKQNRIIEFDLLRIMALFCVIGQHILGAFARRNPGPITSCGILILFEFMRFAVPCFFILAGASLTLSVTNYNYKNYLLKRCTNILIPYIIYSIFYECYSNFIFEKQQFLFKNSVFYIKLLSDILKGQAAYHLWYVPVIMQFAIISVIFVYLLKAPLTNKQNSIIWVLLLLISLALMFVCHKKTNIFISWSFYYIFGILLGKYFNIIINKLTQYKWIFIILYIGGISIINIKDCKFIIKNVSVNFNIFSLLDPTYAMFAVMTVVMFILLIYGKFQKMQKIIIFFSAKEVI